jgi:hypothetical protein
MPSNLIPVAIVGLWFAINLLSAILAASTARKYGYNGGVFFRYGLLAGPWAFAAARKAPLYDVAVLEEETVEELPSGHDALPSDIEHWVEDETPEPFTEPAPAEEPAFEAVPALDEQESVVVPLDEEETPAEELPYADLFAVPVENPYADSGLETPDVDPEHLAAMEDILAAAALDMELQLDGPKPVVEEPVEEPVEPVAPADDEFAAPSEDGTLQGWETRDGSGGSLNLKDLGDVDRSGRTRNNRKAKDEEELPVDAPVSEEVAEETEKPKKRGLFGRKPKEPKIDLPPVEMVKEVPVALPIADAIAPEAPTHGVCNYCKLQSYSDSHGLCVRCANVWEVKGGKPIKASKKKDSEPTPEAEAVSTEA